MIIQHCVQGLSCNQKSVPKRSQLVARAAESDVAGDSEVDTWAIVRYFGATSLQWGLMMGALAVLDFSTSALANTSAPDWSSKVIFVFFSRSELSENILWSCIHSIETKYHTSRRCTSPHRLH